MKTTKRKVGFIYHIPEDSSDVMVEELRSRLGSLNRNQLEMIILILSQEILKFKHQLQSHSSPILDPGEKTTNGGCQKEDREVTQSETNCSTCPSILRSIPDLSHPQALKLGEIKQQEEVIKNATFLIYGVCEKDLNSNNEIASDCRNITKINMDAQLPYHQTCEMSSSMDDPTFVGMSHQNDNHVGEIAGMEFHEDLLPSNPRKSNMEAADSGNRKMSSHKQLLLQPDADCKDSSISLQGLIKDVEGQHPQPITTADNNSKTSLQSIDSNHLYQQQHSLPDKSDEALPRCHNKSDEVVPRCHNKSDVVLPRCHNKSDVALPRCHNKSDEVVPRCHNKSDEVVPRCHNKSDVVLRRCHNKSDVVVPRCHNKSNKSDKLQHFNKNKKCTISKQSSRISTSQVALETAEEKAGDLSCYLCKVDFQSKLMLTHHMKTEHKAAKYSCMICGKSFTYKHNMKIHQRNRHNRTTVLCSYCGKLVLQTRLETHMEKVHEKPLFTCHICQKGFLKRECLEGHINKHSNTKPYICECCGRKYAYSTSLSSHKRQCSRASLPPHLQHPRSLDNKNSSFICEICGVKFEGVSGLKDHISAKHGNKFQSCNFCSKTFQWRPSYNRHVKKCRERTEVERERCRQLLCQKSGVKQFVCVCGKQYLYRQSYRRHAKSCNQTQEVECGSAAV